MPGKRRQLIAVCQSILLSAGLGSPASSAVQSLVYETREINEQALKVAFLLNFAKFVEWPAEAFGSGSDPVVIGVLGQDPFGGVLDETFQRQSLNGRNFRVERFAHLQDLKPCHVLFVSGSEKKKVRQLLTTLGASHVLTVGDMSDFAPSGGIIGFFNQGDRLGLEVNVDAAERAGLRISSKLLKLAKVIREKRKG